MSDLYSTPWFDLGSSPWQDCCLGPLYISGYGGYSTVENFHREISRPDLVVAAGDVVIEKQGPGILDGYASGASIGRYFLPRARTELDVTYRDHGIGDWQSRIFTNGLLSSAVIQDAAGRLESYSLMYNLIVESDERLVGCTTVYGGFGLGVIQVDGTIVTPTNTYDVSDASFAIQALVGINRPFSERLDAFIEYRYVTAQNIRVDDLTSAVSLGDFSYDSHNVFIGVRLFR